MVSQKLKKLSTPALLLLGFLPLSLLLVFNGGQVQVQSITLPTIKEVPDTTWKKLSQTDIWFGHQSVGANILDGVEDVIKENPQIKINVVESSLPPSAKTPALTHFPVGRNADPQSKINDFQSFLTKNKVQKPDIAFFKFCYVDIASYTPDISQVFNHYKTTLANVVKANPQTTFVVVTVPLTTEPNGIDNVTSKAKNWTRKLLKGEGYLTDNLARGKFNDLLRKEYEGKLPIFDLAKAESTATDGKQQMYSEGGQNYFALVPSYTDDGGHLNQVGRKAVAEQFLVFLASLSK
jgi:hypothetical protein